jgi:glucose/arabinose dehydrogenase
MTLVLAAALALVGAAEARIRVPHGYRASLYARGLAHPTAMAFGPDGRLYVTEDTGAVVAVEPGARRPRPFLRGLPTPLGLAWHGRTLFVSVAGGIRSVRLRGGRATASRTVVRGLPFGRHQQDNVVVGRDGRLYLGNGSTCDVCRERDPRSAAILSFRLDGSDTRVVAHGLRNPFGLAVQPRTARLFASVNGQDELGGAEPAEAVVVVRRGADYGWPRCRPSRRLLRLVGSCRGVTRPVAYLEPHSSADGIVFWGRDLYVAEWGEYASRRRGRKVVRLRFDRRGRPLARVARTFASGFHHPLALAVDPRGGLLVADWGTGRIVRIAPRAGRLRPLQALLRTTARLLEL